MSVYWPARVTTLLPPANAAFFVGFEDFQVEPEHLAAVDFTKKIGVNKSAWKKLPVGIRGLYAQQTKAGIPHSLEVALLVFYLKKEPESRLIVSVTHAGLLPCLCFSTSADYRRFTKLYGRNVKYNMQPFNSTVVLEADGTVICDQEEEESAHVGRFCEKATGPNDLARFGEMTKRMAAAINGLDHHGLGADELAIVLWNAQV